MRNCYYIYSFKKKRVHILIKYSNKKTTCFYVNDMICDYDHKLSICGMITGF